MRKAGKRSRKDKRRYRKEAEKRRKSEKDNEMDIRKGENEEWKTRDEG